MRNRTPDAPRLGPLFTTGAEDAEVAQRNLRLYIIELDRGWSLKESV